MTTTKRGDVSVSVAGLRPFGMLAALGKGTQVDDTPSGTRRRDSVPVTAQCGSCRDLGERAVGREIMLGERGSSSAAAAAASGISLGTTEIIQNGVHNVLYIVAFRHGWVAP